MKKLVLASAVGLLLAGCNSNNPNDNPTGPEFPDAGEVAPVKKGLYIASELKPNCGIPGIKYVFQDEAGAVIGEPRYTDEQGFIDLDVKLPLTAKYVTYLYAPEVDYAHWDASTFELAMFAGEGIASKVKLQWIDEAAYTQCGAIEGKTTELGLSNVSAADSLNANHFALLDDSQDTLTLAHNGPVMVAGYQNDKLVGTQLIDSRELESGEMVEVALDSDAEQVWLHDTLEGTLPAAAIQLQYANYPTRMAIDTPSTEDLNPMVNLVNAIENGGINLASFEHVVENDFFAQRVAQMAGELLALNNNFEFAEDGWDFNVIGIPTGYTEGVTYPFMMNKIYCGHNLGNILQSYQDLVDRFPGLDIPNLREIIHDATDGRLDFETFIAISGVVDITPECNLNDLSYELAEEEMLETGKFAAHYSARYFTGTGNFNGECVEKSNCKYIYRNVYAMAEHLQADETDTPWPLPPGPGYSHGTFFIPDVPEELTFSALGGMITRQSFVLSDQQDPQFLHALAAGEANQLIANDHWVEKEIPQSRLEPLLIPGEPLSEEAFEARYQSEYQAVGRFN
ncbi:hypothetical protein [Ferrimonas marina]|uniref:Uncharacterized protein n=1 Tax=Ferrimonas marina TaxID=299255 RepID=A0A1M5VYW7_9GAMM|nr:hypothetical protein [Ferrimonas marina]SHH80472.1 hypothetical protein SAMN02745129_3073 [Ferrimonas marina]